MRHLAVVVGLACRDAIPAEMYFNVGKGKFIFSPFLSLLYLLRGFFYFHWVISYGEAVSRGLVPFRFSVSVFVGARANTPTRAREPSVAFQNAEGEKRHWDAAATETVNPMK